jgi:hypothetical protein
VIRGNNFGLIKGGESILGWYIDTFLSFKKSIQLESKLRRIGKG